MERELALGRARAQAGQPSLALAHFEDALRAHPAAPEPYLELGQALAQLGRSADAIALLRAGRRRAPGHTGLTLALADALAASGQPRQALVLLRVASRRRPRSLGIEERRAAMAQAQGAWSEAADAYAAILDIDRQGAAVPAATLARARQMLGALAIVLDDGHPRASRCADAGHAPDSADTRWRNALADCALRP